MAAALVMTATQWMEKLLTYDWIQLLLLRCDCA